MIDALVSVPPWPPIEPSARRFADSRWVGAAPALLVHPGANKIEALVFADRLVAGESSTPPCGSVRVRGRSRAAGRPGQAAPSPLQALPRR
jgi:hypothetical protein